MAEYPIGIDVASLLVGTVPLRDTELSLSSLHRLIKLLAVIFRISPNFK